jgi:hypothetical protein
MGNRRGVVDVAVVALIAVCGVIMWLCGPTVIKATGTMIHGNGGNQKKATRSIQSERTLYQVDPQNPDKLIPVKEKYKEESYALDAQEPEDSLWTKFWHLGAMAVLIIVVLSYLGLWPIITLWWNKKIKPKIEATKAKLEEMEEEKDTLRGDAKLIVISIDEGLAAVNTAIAAAQSTYDVTQATLNSAALIEDQTLRPVAISNAQISVSRARAILDALINVKKEFLSAMSRKQDTTTKLLVSELKND